MRKGIALVSASAVFYGLMPLVTTMFYSMGFSVVSASFWRFFPIVPVLLVTCRALGIDFNLPRRQQLAVCVRCGLPSGLTMFLLNASYAYIDTGLATTIHFLYPALVALLSFLVYHDSITRALRRAVVIIVVGMALIAGQVNLGMGGPGLACALLSAVTYAVYLLQLDHGGYDRLNPLVLTLYVAATNSVLMFAAGLLTEPVQFPASAAEAATALAIAGMSLCALSLLAAGSSRLMAQYTAVFGLLEPLASIVCGVAFMHEGLGLGKVAGCALVLYAILSVALEGRSLAGALPALRRYLRERTASRRVGG